MKSNKNRVLRDGSWSSIPSYCRPAKRFWYFPSFHYYYFGFRVVRVPRIPLVNKGDKEDGK